MASPLKETGEVVRTQSANADMDLSSAKAALYKALIDGSTDPVEYVKAIALALQKIESAHAATKEINRICEMAALRGPYSK